MLDKTSWLRLQRRHSEHRDVGDCVGHGRERKEGREGEREEKGEKRRI